MPADDVRSTPAARERGMKSSFRDFAELCERLEGISSNNRLRDELASFFSGLEIGSVRPASYFLLGVIGPKYEDIDLGLGSKSVIPILAEAFGEEEPKVKRMFSEEGDLGVVAGKLSSRKRSSLSLDDVFKKLWKVRSASGSGSREKKSDILSGLLSDASSVEAKYIVRIALSSLRLGVGEKTLIDAFAVAFTGDSENSSEVEDGYNVCTDIGRLGESLAKNGLRGVRRFSISLGRPVQCMLAQRVDRVSDILEKMDEDEIAAEEKYDGERVQIHKDGGSVTLFSRRLEDITHQYPDVVDYVKKAVRSRKAVLDGEIVAYSKGGFMSFQKLMSRRRKYDVESYRKKVPVVVFVFDMLYLNGRSLLRKPYPERRKLLESSLKRSDKIRPAGRKVSEDFSVIREFFRKSVDKGLEGIIVKSTSKDSFYRPGKRGWRWIKWKKEYAEGMQETFDLVVIGGYHGKGRRKGVFGALLCAVYDRGKDRFESFTRVGAGFSDADLKRLSKMLRKKKKPGRPDRVVVKRGMEPDEYYAPDTVIEVTGAEITRSPSHAAGERDGKGLALRFPRFLRVRDDKGPEDATKVKEVVSLRR